MFLPANAANGSGALATLQALYADDSSGDDENNNNAQSEEESMDCGVQKRTIPPTNISEEDGVTAKRRRTDESSLLPSPLSLAATFFRSPEGDTVADHHEGRVRAVPHVRGSWAGLVFVACSDTAEPSLTSLVAACVTVCEAGSLTSVCGTGSLTSVARADWHVSLSRTLYLRHHWIEQLVGRLRRVVSHHPRFTLTVTGAAVYVNDEKTRTFIGLTVCAGRMRLHQLCADVNTCLAEYGLPPYYQEADFHMSIVWCVGDVAASLRSRILPQLSVVIEQYRSHADLSFDVSSVSFKCGNKLYQLPLSS